MYLHQLFMGGWLLYTITGYIMREQSRENGNKVREITETADRKTKQHQRQKRNTSGENETTLEKKRETSGRK